MIFFDDACRADNDPIVREMGGRARGERAVQESRFILCCRLWLTQRYRNALEMGGLLGLFPGVKGLFLARAALRSALFSFLTC